MPFFLFFHETRGCIGLREQQTCIYYSPTHHYDVTSSSCVRCHVRVGIVLSTNMTPSEPPRPHDPISLFCPLQVDPIMHAAYFSPLPRSLLTSLSLSFHLSLSYVSSIHIYSRFFISPHHHHHSYRFHSFLTLSSLSQTHYFSPHQPPNTLTNTNHQAYRYLIHPSSYSPIALSSLSLSTYCISHTGLLIRQVQNKCLYTVRTTDTMTGRQNWVTYKYSDQSSPVPHSSVHLSRECRIMGQGYRIKTVITNVYNRVTKHAAGE